MINHRHLLVRSKILSAISCMTYSPKCSSTGSGCMQCHQWFFQFRHSRRDSRFAVLESHVRMFALLFKLDRSCYASLGTTSWLFPSFFLFVETHEFRNKWLKCCENILGMKPSRNCFSNLCKSLSPKILRNDTKDRGSFQFYSCGFLTVYSSWHLAIKDELL